MFSFTGSELVFWATTVEVGSTGVKKPEMKWKLFKITVDDYMESYYPSYWGIIIFHYGNPNNKGTTDGFEHCSKRDFNGYVICKVMFPPSSK